jgi:hypothetical protein
MDKSTGFDTSDCDEAPEPTLCPNCDGCGASGRELNRPCFYCKGKGELYEAADPDGDRDDYYERIAEARESRETGFWS